MTSQAKILVIEDEEDAVRLLTFRFQQEGYEVLSATDGVEGLRILQQEHLHLVVLDVMMPRMNNWETCKRIRQYSDVPIIMLRALGQETDKVRGLELGADDFVTKPFSLAEFIARVRAALRGRQPLSAKEDRRESR